MLDQTGDRDQVALDAVHAIAAIVADNETQRIARAQLIVREAIDAFARPLGKPDERTPHW